MGMVSVDLNQHGREVPYELHLKRPVEWSNPAAVLLPRTPFPPIRLGTYDGRCFVVISHRCENAAQRQSPKPTTIQNGMNRAQ